MRPALWSAGIWLVMTSTVHGAEVSGQVTMPEVCSPEVSPAVVILESQNGPGSPGLVPASPADVALINQRGLQFVPRVQALTLGQTLRFSNQDAETHNVHVVSSGNQFNQSMAPGQPGEFIPTRPGVLKVVCDVHSHMRAFVVVSASPWSQVCSREGRFRFADVPAGRYRLSVWHELGDPVNQTLTVTDGTRTTVKTISLSGPVVIRSRSEAAPSRSWPEVIDRIGVLLASSLDAATRPGGVNKARRLAEDSYWGEFEASDMETAVRSHLGFARAGELEGKFRACIAGVTAVADGRQPASTMGDLTRALLHELLRAADELNRQGITDRDHVFASAPLLVAPSRTSLDSDDPQARLGTLKSGLARVRQLAARDEPDLAASAMSAVYFDEFEPVERFVAVRKPQDVRPLESHFNALRGEISAGLKGFDLGVKLDALIFEVETSVGRSRAQHLGTFWPACAASLITILREGVEVILLLTMLFALAAKIGERSALISIRWGVGLAVVASIVTAVGLNRLVAATQGRTREIVEGSVMLAAAGVLFYVSYWLISQSESKRWMDFLKRQARRGLEVGGHGTLALTAFLAVYREGAETALMYQALIAGQGQSRAGLVGVASGLGAGLILLAAIALAIRATSVRLPLRPFFKLTGGVLFAMAVVFAGNGIFELQSSGILKVSPLPWLGQGLPILGLHPNVQALSVQALLISGAVLALVLLLAGDGPSRLSDRITAQESQVDSKPKAGVGV